MLSLDTILATDTLQPRKVQVPEWGGHVYVAALTADQRDEFETEWQRIKDARKQEDNVGFRAFLVASTLCDESNRLLCVNGKRESSADALGAKAAGPINRIFNAACELNGLTKDDVEELEKNSEAAPAPLSTDGK